MIPFVVWIALEANRTTCVRLRLNLCCWYLIKVHCAEEHGFSVQVDNGALPLRISGDDEGLVGRLDIMYRAPSDNNANQNKKKISETLSTTPCSGRNVNIRNHGILVIFFSSSLVVCSIVTLLPRSFHSRMHRLYVCFRWPKTKWLDIGATAQYFCLRACFSSNGGRNLFKIDADVDFDLI